MVCACITFAVSGADIRNGASKLPAALETLIRTYPKPVDDALRGLARAVGSYQQGRYAAVLDEMPGTDAARATALGDYFILYRAKAGLSLDRGREALELFLLLQKEFPSSPLVTDSILGESQALLKLHDAGAARSVLDNPNLSQNAESLFLQGRAEEEAGQTRKATDLYLRVYTDFVTSRQSAMAQERLLALSPKSATGQSAYAALLRRAENMLAAGMNREAQAVLLKLARIQAPDKASGEKRYVLLAEAETRLGKAAAVLPYLGKVGDSDPALHAQSLYLKAVCYRRLKKEDSLLQTRNLASRLYAQSAFTEKILYSVATYFDVSDRPREARAAYQQLAERFPTGPNAERALWKAALYSYVDRQHEEALKGFWSYLQAFPTPRAAAAPIYWMGRCYERLGDRTAARSLYQRAFALASHGYYGQRSREAESALEKSGPGQALASIDFAQITAVLDSIQRGQSVIPEPSSPATQTIERVRQLVTAGLPELALSELRWGIRRYPQEKALSYLLSRVYALRKDYEGVFSTLRRAFPDYDGRAIGELPEQVWELLFPFEHWSVINSQAKKNKIDPTLILGVIRQESAFKENARSPANARGLMQVLPGTGRTLAGQLGVRYTVARLFRAETNITLGTRHLASLLRQYGGKEELALAAYNAGDARVDQWMSKFGDVDMAEFVERIPFSETRGYVKQVLTNKAYYDLLQASGADPPPPEVTVRRAPTESASVAAPKLKAAQRPKVLPRSVAPKRVSSRARKQRRGSE